jgi:putative membrane protein
MKRHHTSVLLGATALALASAAEAQVRTTGSGIPVSKDEAAVSVSTTPSTTTTTVSGGDVTLTTPFDLSAYVNKMNEKNITAHMAAGDSLEIQLGQLAQSKGTSQQVRDFGAMLVTDHQAHLTKTHEIITDEDVGAEPMAYDPEGMRMRQMLTMLRDMSAGSAWDAAFLRFQAGHHQNEIDLLSANIKNAHDDDLEDHIEKSITSLGKHRDHAKSVATSLGVTL